MRTAKKPRNEVTPDERITQIERELVEEEDVEEEAAHDDVLLVRRQDLLQPPVSNAIH